MHNSLLLQQVLGFLGAAFMGVNPFQYQFGSTEGTAMEGAVK